MRRAGCCFGIRRLCGPRKPISLVVLRLTPFAVAHALHRQHRIVRTAIALLADAHLFTPEVALNGVALRHLVVTVTLLETHPRAIAELAQQRVDLPLNVSRRTFGRIIEENLVLNLQPTKLLIEEIHFLIDGHKDSPDNSLAASYGLGEVPAGHEGDGTKVL